MLVKLLDRNYITSAEKQFVHSSAQNPILSYQKYFFSVKKCIKSLTNISKEEFPVWNSIIS